MRDGRIGSLCMPRPPCSLSLHQRIPLPPYGVSDHIRPSMPQQRPLLAKVTPVDTDTSIPFPLRLQLTAHVPPLSLVGLGVRKVSFLRVKVYSVGFYVDERALAQLDHVPGFAVSS